MHENNTLQKPFSNIKPYTEKIIKQNMFERGMLQFKVLLAIFSFRFFFHPV